MHKKFIGIFLALMLIFGGIASAGELGFHADLVPANETATFRGVLSGFYGEIVVGGIVDVKGDKGDLDDLDYQGYPGNELDKDIIGTNIGIKLETEDPFYGVGQINFGAVPLHVKDEYEVVNEPFKKPYNVKGYDWRYKAIEIGGGAEIQAFGNVNVGVEATLVNKNPADLSEYSPNFSVFATLDFAAFPSPQLETE